MPRLLPLPQCEGPKLEPFTQDFESIKLEPELLVKDYDGFAHGMVLKAMLDGKTYAIKFFIKRWLPPDHFTKKYPGLSDEEEKLARMHDDPFYAECRAFGRLKETGMEHLAVKAHGYVRVDTNERTTEMLRPAFAMERGETSDLDDFFADGNIDFETGEHIPVMGIVKDWIDGGEYINQSVDLERHYRKDLENHQYILRQASSNLDNLHQLHKHGIVVRDIHDHQYIKGTLVDLSCSWTTPHVLAQGDRFRPDWSLASLAARDLYEFQELIHWENSNRDVFVRGLRELGYKTPKMRPAKVDAYPRTGTRQGLRARPPRGPGGAKPLPLLNYRESRPYDPEAPIVPDRRTYSDGLLWTYGPKYDPAQFRWREVGKTEGVKDNKDRKDTEEVDDVKDITEVKDDKESDQDKVTKGDTARKVKKRKRV